MQIIQSSFTKKILLSQKCSLDIKLYDKFKNCTSVSMRKRFIAANISVNIIDAYKEHGLTCLFSADENSNIRVTNNKKVKTMLINYSQSINLISISFIE